MCFSGAVDLKRRGSKCPFLCLVLRQTQLAEWAALGKTLGTNSGKAGGFVALDSWHPSCGVTADTVLDITINL